MMRRFVRWAKAAAGRHRTTRIALVADGLCRACGTSPIEDNHYRMCWHCAGDERAAP
jgi:hypothetical protein